MAANDAPKEVLEFFALLPHKQPAIYSWLQDRSRSYDVRMRKERDDVTFRQVQGRAQEINDILELVQQAPEILGKQRRA